LLPCRLVALLSRDLRDMRLPSGVGLRREAVIAQVLTWWLGGRLALLMPLLVLPMLLVLLVLLLRLRQWLSTTQRVW